MPTRPDEAGELPPRCRHFRLCGGCTRLTTPLEVQSSRLDQALISLLGERLPPAGLNATLRPPAPATGWRTKLIYMATGDAVGLPFLGLYARDSHRVVRISECAIQDPRLTTCAVHLEAALRAARLPVHQADPTGIRQHGLRALWLRLMPGTNELLIGLVCSGSEPWPEELADHLRAAGTIPGTSLVGLARIRNDSLGNRILSNDITALHGDLHQHDSEDGLRLRYHLTSFRQAHKDAHRLLYQPALDLVGDVAGWKVVDGYGGVGAFALRLARLGAEVTLVESHPAAILDAAHNAATNHLKLTIVEAPFADAELQKRPDLLVLDPPRSGLRPEGVARVLALDPARVLYVACGPEALRADLDLLLHRYAVTAAVRVDLFPHTDHSEAILHLQRR